MRARALFLAAICAVVLAACGQPGFAPGARGVPLQLRAPHLSPVTSTGSFLGVYEPGVPDSYRPVEKFGAAVGRQPNIALYFSGTHQPFASAFADQASAHGAVPLVQMDPSGISMASVAAGRSDGYLRTFAASVRAYRHPVIIGYAHEMNGNWYPWGAGHVPPAIWVAAWRHVVTVFRSQGADNVIWMWTINDLLGSSVPVRDYWPGRKYVTWIGIDAYLATPAATFGTVLAPTVAAVRRFSRDPVLIAETAIGPEAGQAAKIPGLFAGIRKDHLLGLVWFDVAQHGGLYHQDWRLEDNSSALAKFRHEVTKFSRHGAG